MIRFRGKQIDNGKWIKGLPTRYPADAIKVNAILLDDYYENDFGMVCGHVEKVDPSTVGMGVEIDGKWYFEGDLVTAIWYDSDEPALKLTGEIIFSEGWKCFCIWDGDSKTISELNAAGHEDWTLGKIGTKWDNPELGAGK